MRNGPAGYGVDGGASIADCEVDVLRVIHLKNKKKGAKVVRARSRMMISVARIAWTGSGEAVGEMARGGDDETSVCCEYRYRRRDTQGEKLMAMAMASTMSSSLRCAPRRTEIVVGKLW